MDFEVWHIWVICALLFALLEIFTPSFIALCIAIGCLFSALGAALDASFEVQLLLFSVGTALSVFTIRPFMLKIEHRKSNAVKTNIEALAGKTGRVIEKVNNSQGSGRAIVEGDDWRVMTDDNTVINEGEIIEVIRVDSVRLIVRQFAS